MVSVQWGLQNSDNWVTAWLMSQLSPYTFIRLLHSFGLKNEMDPVVSICLGTPDVSVGEMVSGYTTFANKGIRVEPLYVTRIEDPYGNTIANFNSQMSEVLTEDASYKMLHMLKNVIDGGTGGRIRARYGIKAPMGGKTGTTQNNSDGWFMGLRRAWYPVSGSAVKIVLSISTGCRKDRELVWLCQSMDFTCRKFMPTKRWAIRRKRISTFPNSIRILVKWPPKRNENRHRQMWVALIRCLNKKQACF